jgi:hypothetical protein
MMRWKHWDIALAVPILGAALCAAATAYAYPPRQKITYVPPPFDGRTGHVRVHNPYSKEVTVELWHPDSRSLWGKIPVGAKQRTVLSDQNGPLTLGMDWGIRLENTKVVPLMNAHWKEQPGGGYEVEVDLERIFK